MAIKETSFDGRVFLDFIISMVQLEALALGRSYVHQSRQSCTRTTFHLQRSPNYHLGCAILEWATLERLLPVGSISTAQIRASIHTLRISGLSDRGDMYENAIKYISELGSNLTHLALIFAPALSGKQCRSCVFDDYAHS